MGHTFHLQLDMVDTTMNVLYRVDDQDKFIYYAGFAFNGTRSKCTWSIEQPMLLDNCDLDDCVRDIRESYDGVLFTMLLNGGPSHKV
jgi:hypothetical protein